MISEGEMCVRLLLAAGARVDARSDNGSMPLHEAVRFNRAAVVELLLQSAADPGARDREGRHPLALAAAFGHEACLNVLLTHADDPDVPELTYDQERGVTEP